MRKAIQFFCLVLISAVCVGLMFLAFSAPATKPSNEGSRPAEVATVHPHRDAGSKVAEDKAADDLIHASFEAESPDLDVAFEKNRLERIPPTEFDAINAIDGESTGRDVPRLRLDGRIQDIPPPTSFEAAEPDSNDDELEKWLSSPTDRVINRNLGADDESSEDEAAEPDRDIRDLAKIVLEGVESFERIDIIRALSTDFELQAAARPRVLLSDYLAQLKTAVERGYRCGGFPRVHAEVECSGNPPSFITVRIDEGPRFRCGKLTIVGMNQVPVEDLKRELLEIPHPSKILWNPGRPTPFDPQFISEVKSALETCCSKHAYYHPKIEIEFVEHPEDQTAELKATILNEGLRAVIGDVSVVHQNERARDPADEVLKLLDITRGAPRVKQLVADWEKRLEDSGRFLSVKISPTEIVEDSSRNIEYHNLVIQIRDYAEAPPLREDLSEGQQTILKVRNWIMQWQAGKIDADLVIEAKASDETSNRPSPSSDQDPDHETQSDPPSLGHVELKTIIGPGRGQIMSLKLETKKGEPMTHLLFHASQEGTVLASLLRKDRLIYRNTGSSRYFATFKIGINPRRDESRFLMNFGFSRKHRKADDPVLFGVQTEVTAAALLRLIESNPNGSKSSDGVRTYELGSSHLRIEEATGRLIEFSVRADWADISIRTEQAALSRELQSTAPSISVCQEREHDGSPVQSLVQFFNDEFLAAVEAGSKKQAIASIRAWKHFCEVWAPPSLIELEAFWNDEPAVEGDLEFLIPPETTDLETEIQLDSKTLRARIIVSNIIIPVLRELLPRRGTSFATARDIAFEWAGYDRAGSNKLWQSNAVQSLDPDLRDVLVRFNSSVLKIVNFFAFMGPAQSNLSDDSLLRVESAAIADGWNPILAEDSWSSRWLLSVYRAVQKIDRDEFLDLCRLANNCREFSPEVEAVLSLFHKQAQSGDAIDRVVQRFSEQLFRE